MEELLNEIDELLAHFEDFTLSIMRTGTIFYKMKDRGYYSDGFHLILGRICKNCTDYFQKLTTN